MDVAHPSPAAGEAETSIRDILRLPTPEQPGECAQGDLVLVMLARGVPLSLLPDLAWPGRIPDETAGPQPMLGTVSSAATTGPIGIVTGRSTKQAASLAIGRHVGAAATEQTGEEVPVSSDVPVPVSSDVPVPVSSDVPVGRHDRTLPDRHGGGEFESVGADFPAGLEAC